MLDELLAELERNPAIRTIRETAVLYASVESVHIVSLGVLVGSAAALDIRLLGASRATSVQRLARHLLPLVWFGFIGAATSGLLLFAAHATSLAHNPAFQLKVGLIALAGTNAAAFHLGPGHRMASWDRGLPPPATARTCGAISLTLWVAVTVCGRTIAYL